ncbi:MAG: anthranilate synthase component I [Candidatus Sumerlaeaceae bacterium]|nr:anthranilate synthase component I [Candidatus Sumerlaeaceae bacterium]
METPVSAYKKICDSRFGFLLESVEGGETVGRYSFLGANPQTIFKSKRQEIEIFYGSGRKESFSDPMPLDRLRDLLQHYRFVIDPTLPPFCGGAVGYMSYDEVKNLESIGSKAEDDRELPDMFFMITDTLLIFDHLRHRLKILANAHITSHAAPLEAYEEALRKINSLHQKLMRPNPRSDYTVNLSGVQISSNLSQDEFTEMVDKCKEYIAAGDAFQIVASQRFVVPISCDWFDIYRALRAVNPSPYMFFLQLDDICLAGSSPEVLVKVIGNEVQLRPIAGTRPRGETREQDLDLEKELLADPKECAEHVMLVDLGRNDVGRVCEYGSVHVDDFKIIERYSHVMHIVSNVRGRLRRDFDAIDVLKASFPAGTVSGAPKIRAMQIIDELEPVQRGPYAGAVGYISYNGNLDTCITIRTIVMQGDKAYMQAGAGIVADSDPVAEYKETINKAGALIRAIEMAEGGME